MVRLLHCLTECKRRHTNCIRNHLHSLRGLTSGAATCAFILPRSWSCLRINGLICGETDAVGTGGMMMIDDDFPPMGDQSGLLPSPVQTDQPSRHGPAFPHLAATAAPSDTEPALPTQPRQRRYASISSFFDSSTVPEGPECIQSWGKVSSGLTRRCFC